MSNLDIISRVRARGKRVFYGWWVVAAGASINAVGIGSFFYGFSTFFTPMITEFNWSRTVMSGAFSLSRLEGGIWSPVTGWLIDRYGARRILLIGVTMTGAGFIALYWINSPLSLYLIFGLFLSLGFNMGFMRANTAAVTKWFIKKRSRAISFLTVGNGVGGAIPLTLALQGDLFGRRHFASISGMMMPVTMIGTIVAPLVAAYLYDTTQSYNLIFYIFTAMVSLSGVFFLLIPRPSPPHRHPRQVSP